MGNSKTSSVLIVLGFILLGIGIIFKAYDFPDSFFGMYTGPFLIIVGLIFGAVGKTGNKNENDCFQLSSRITFVYKTVVPILGLVGFTIYFFLAIRAGKYLNLYVPLGLIIFFVWLLFLLLVSRLIQYVSYSETQLIIGRHPKIRIVSGIEVKSIDRVLFNFYMITLTNTKIVFIPHFFETLNNPLGDPESIVIFKKMMKL